MKLLIDVQEEDYQFLKEGYSHLKIKEHLTDTRDNRCYVAIANGTPLQEKLKDIKSEIENVDLFNEYFFDKHFKSPLDMKNDIFKILDNYIGK